MTHARVRTRMFRRQILPNLSVLKWGIRTAWGKHSMLPLILSGTAIPIDLQCVGDQRVVIPWDASPIGYLSKHFSYGPNSLCSE